MLKVANIYPIANQDMYIYEDIVMVLAHLIDKYKAKNFRLGSYIIMDNGLYEKAQVSTDLQKCVDLALESELHINEIIVPDVVNDTEGTIALFEKNLPVMNTFREKFAFMFVAQATTYKELERAITYINQYANSGIRLTVGISKLSPLQRDSEEAIKLYKRCLFPIHFLGIKESFDELLKVQSVIRSCDSSQTAFMVKNEAYRLEDFNIVNYHRKGEDINLEKDHCNGSLLYRLLILEKASKIYELL